MKYSIANITINIGKEDNMRDATVAFRDENGKIYSYMVTRDAYNDFVRQIVNPEVIYALLDKDDVERDDNIYTPPQNIIDRWMAENDYILFCRSLGLPDVASTEDFDVLVNSLMPTDPIKAMGIGLKALALINRINQNGGKWDSIKWHDL